MIRSVLMGGVVLGLCGCGGPGGEPGGEPEGAAPPPSDTQRCEQLEAPEVVGTTDIDNPLLSSELVVIGDTAYMMAFQDAAVERFDLSRPTAIEALPSLPLPEDTSVRDLIAHGDHLLLVGSDLVITEPGDDALHEVSRLELEGDHSASGVVVDDLLVFEGNEPAAVELRDLAQPAYVEIEGLAERESGVYAQWASGSVMLGSYGVEGLIAVGRTDAGEAAVLREYDAEERVRHAMADQDAGLVYALTQTNGGLEKFSLVVLAESGTDTYTELGRALATTWALGMQRYGDQLAVFHEDVIQLYDVSDPTEPQGLESIEYREGSFLGGARLVFAGGYGVVANETALDMVLLCDPTAER